MPIERAPSSFKPERMWGLIRQAFGPDRPAARRSGPAPRRAQIEAIEARVLLSADIAPLQSPDDDPVALAGGSAVHAALAPAAVAPVIAPLSGAGADAAGATQVFWINADGASGIRYDGPVQLDGITVAAFDAQGRLDGQEDAILDQVLASLDATFDDALHFTLERPEGGAFSTIYLGQGAQWFDAWGRYAGLAEQVDLGNADRDDIAFVFTDVLASGVLPLQAYAQQLAAVVAHEAGHLVGLSHGHADGDGPLAPVAFDPRVHAEIGQDARADAIDDGKVTIAGNEYTVHPLLVQALTNHEAYFNAGTVAGDGFPDVLMGQFAIHPIEHATWLTRILDMAWAAQGDASYSAAEKGQILAWSYGFLSHSAADHWAHTLVNDMAEGVAPGFVAAAQDQRDLGNMLRHFMVEAYIADALPGFDTNPDRTLVNGDYSDNATPARSFEAPVRFIYEALIRPFAQDPTPVVEMDWDGGTLSAVPNAGGADYFERSAGDFTEDGFKVGHKITVTGFGANNGVFTVAAVTAGRLSVVEALSDEAASGDEAIVVKVPATAQVDIDYTVSGTTAKFVRNDGGSFVADGFVADMRFSTHGFGNAVPGDFIVKTVAANEIVVVGVPVAASAAGNGDERLVAYGQRGPAIDGLFKLRDALYKKAVELGTRAQAGSFGNQAGQLIEDLVTGAAISAAQKDQLFHAYLYNWVDEIDEGVRAWGEVGLAFSKAMFDPQSRRDLQNQVGEATGQADLADPTTLRSKAEDAVGVLDVLIAELDDPNGDQSVGDGYINRHLLPMIGLPQELGMLRTVLVDFGNAVDEVLAPVGDAIDAVVNPIKEGIDDLKDYAKNWIKTQIEKRWGFSFEVFDYLRDLGAKMDLKQITLPAGLLTVPVFRPGDHEKLDAILGLDALPNHHEAPPAGYDQLPGHVLEFYADADGGLTDAAAFEKTGANAFAAYANSVTLTKMVFLMEDSGEAGVASPAADGQMSALVNDVRSALGLANVNYDYGNNNLHGAHGGNFLTTTLPGVAGDTPWMVSIDADQVWRQDNTTTRNMLFRIAVDNDALSPAVYEKAVVAGTAYQVYASWQANVTQDVDDQTNALLPDRKMVPAQFAAYSVIDGAATLATVNKDQRLFPADLAHSDGLSYALLGSYTFASGVAKVSLSNLSGLGENVLAGPVLLVPVGGGAAIRIANDRHTGTLAPVPGNGYSDDDAYWDDVVYPSGSGNNPLWESDKLRPVFRALFDDYLNDDATAFPDLGDAATVDANNGAGKTERPSHATPFGPVVPDNTLQVPITDAVKAFIVDGLADLVEFAGSVEKLGPLGLELPGIGRSLGELIDLSQQVHDTLRQPVLDYFAADASPSFNGLFAYLEANSPIGAAIDSFEGLLEFKLDLNKTFNVDTALALVDEAADDFGLEVNGALAVQAQLAVLRGNLPGFVFGIHLGQGTATAADRVYIRADKATFQASAAVPDLDLGARFGFVGVGVADGSLSFNAELALNIGDGADDDGRLTLAEFAAAPTSELSFDAPVGAFSATLPIAVNASFLPSDSQGAVGTVTVSAPQLFDPSSYGIVFAPNAGKSFAELLNFRNIDSASLVGLLGQVTFWLDEFRKSADFADFDVPVLGQVLDDVLGIADAFRDKFLFDDGDDGVDGSRTLVGDLNAALAAKSLSDRLHFEVAAGNTLVLMANNGDVPDFSLTLVNGAQIGFSSAGPYLTSAVPGQLLNAVTADVAAPANGRIGADVTLKIRIGSEPEVQVTLLKADTVTDPTPTQADNTAVGNDRYKLVDAQNAATFKTFQELVQRLADELGLVNVLSYDAAANTLNFDVAINEVLGRKDLPLNFLPTALPEYLKLQTQGMLRLQATGALNLQFGIDLGATGGTLATADGSGDALSTLNGGIEISSDRRIVAPAAVRSVVGALSNDSAFTIAVNGGAGVQVSLPKTSATVLHQTADNVGLADLVSDINAALAAAGLGGTIQAVAAADNIAFQALDGAVTQFVLTTTSGDPLVKELGYLAQTTSSDVGGVQTVATAARAVPVIAPTLLGRLPAGADAVFTVNLGATSVQITVDDAATANNRYAFDIVNDVQAAIDATALTDKHGSTDPEDWDRRLVVGIVGNQLSFTSKDGSTQFTVTGANGAAQTGLGLGAGTHASNGDDVVVGLRNGQSFRVELDGATHLSDVIAKIALASRSDPASAASARVDVAVNARQTGLTLTDKTTGAGKFMVVVANESKAGIQLGIVGADYPEGSPEIADSVIDGADIVGLRPLDRFFIREAASLGSVSLSIATLDDPADLDLLPDGDLVAEAAFGFVGLKLQGDGTASATLSLGLEDPEDDATEDHRVTFAELLDHVAQPSTLFDLSLTGGGSFSLEVLPAVKADLSALGIGVGANASLDIVASFGDVFADTPVAPTFSFQTTGFEDLLKFNNPLGGDLSFQSIVQGLQALADFLGQFERFGFLGEKLPLVNVSIHDLIGIADQFADAVDEAIANPAGTIQLLEGKLESAFGIANPNLLTLGLVVDDQGDADAGNDQSLLRFTIDLAAAFDESLGIQMDVGQWLAGEAGLPDWLTDTIDLGGDAKLGAAGSLGLVLDFGLDLANPLDVYVFEGTAFDAALLASASDIDFRAALGPLGIFVQDGAAGISASVGLGLAAGVFDQGVAGLHARVRLDDLIAAVADDPAGSVEFTLAGAASATLPVYFPTDAQHAGDIVFAMTDLFDTDTVTLTLPDGLLDFDLDSLSLLDQLLLGVDGVDLFLEGLQDLLDGSIGGVELPLIGDKLASGVDVIQGFRNGFLEEFREAISQLADPTAAFNQFVGAGGAGFAALAAPTEADPVSRILGELLGSGGLDLLLDVNGDGSTDGLDIRFKTNLNQAGVVAEDVYFDWDIALGGQLLDVGAGIGFDIGIPGLGLETEGDVTLDVAWSLDLGFGLNFDDGFYLDVGDDADEAFDDATELELRVDAAVPGAQITGTLGFLQLSATDDTDDGDGLTTHLSAVIGVDIFNGANQADTRLGFSELGSIDIDVGIGAEAVVDLGMRLSLSSALVPGAPTNFPSVVADFGLVWRVGDPTEGAVALVPLSELDGSFLKNGLQYVGFEHVGLDLGSYFSDLIGPIVAKVQEVTEPIKPFLDFLTADIPVISQLAGPTSLLDIAALSGVINPGIIEAIEVVDQVVDIAHSLKGLGDAGNVILYFDEYLPELVIYGAKPAAGLAAQAATAAPDIDLSKAPNPDELKKFAESLADSWGLGGLGTALGSVAGAFAEGVTKMNGGGSASKGFSLPIINDPSQIFGMLLGQPATLVQFDMAPLILEADYSQFFPIYGPLGVSINAEFGAQFGPFSFGYDTLGITSFADGDFRNPWLLFDGFYVGDLDAQGNDVPELQFDAGLWAAAELNLGVARGGVGGGLFADIDFDLHDPDDDGRVRIKEMVANVYNEFKYFDQALAPLALFDITGQLTAELFAFLKVDLLLLQIDERWQLTDPIVLLDFASNFTRVPTLATELGDGVLQLNMGKYAKQRIEGDLSDHGETFVVKQADADEVFVWSTLVDFDGDGYDEGEAQRYNAGSLIMALGGEGDDTIDLSGVTAAIRFDIEGNAGNDTITLGRTHAGASGKVLGGAGDDRIEGSDGADNLFGEDGEDTVLGHGGRDWLFGDGKPADSIRADKVRLNPADPVPSTDAYILSSAAKATDDADVVEGGADEDLIFGGGGMDTLQGDGGADVVLGDGGEVVAGTDRLAMALRASGDPARLELRVADTGRGKGAADTIDGGTGDDRLYGGAGDDAILGGADHDVLYGEAGKDDLDGGAGNDVVFGDGGSFAVVNAVLAPVPVSGGDADTLAGGSGDDQLLGGAGNDDLQGGTGADRLWGGVGLDVLRGGAGNDHLYGGADPDQLHGDGDDDYLEGGQGNDLGLGGSGDDLLIAGYGSDTLDGEEGSDTYKVNARGGAITDLTTAYDSGTGVNDTDLMMLVGTPGRDVVLLRAMADFYFPSLEKLVGSGATKGLTDKIFASAEPDKLAAILQMLEDAYGPHTIPAGLVDATIGLWVADRQADLEQAIDDSYELPAIQDLSNPPPTPAELKARIGQILASDSRHKLDEMRAAVTELWSPYRVPGTMLDAIAQAWQPASVALKNAVENGIESRYQDEGLVGLLNLVSDTYVVGDAASYGALVAAIDAAYGGSMPAALAAALDLAYAGGAGSTLHLVGAVLSAYDDTFDVPGIETDTAFVALINNGGKNIERFNYRQIEGLVVNTLQGEDLVAADDVAATTTINLGDDADKVQIGQVFRSERVRDFGTETITGIDPADGFTTTEITRGWLSNGVSRATTVNGGDGNDQFTVFRNVATLNLNGGDGDDVFTVRAFALKGSSDSERARTDMKGDGGADTILYVVNAPVGIDGGDGFDTIRIVGTEFADDFVITDAGIFGAGLNVSYVNIEKLVADGAEGDDRFFVQSTGVEVVTEIDGGLGSDSFFVGGNPSRAPVPVVSNDFKGHSGVILHSIEAGDPAWVGVPVEGLSANVADDEEAMVLVYETGGITRVFEGAVGSASGWAYDSYGIRLSKRPESDVYVKVVPAGLAPEDMARGFQDLQFFTSSTADVAPTDGESLGTNVNTGLSNLPTLHFSTGNWDQLQYVRFRAYADTASEGPRFTFINHTAQTSVDQEFAAVQSLSVKVQLLDDDRDSVVVTSTDGGNKVLEHSAAGATGFTDSFNVNLSRQPDAGASVTVHMRVANQQLVLGGTGVTTAVVDGVTVYSFTIAAADWASARTITVTAPEDLVVEGLHTDYISFEVVSADGDQTLTFNRSKINGDFDKLVGPPLDIPADKPSTYVLLPFRPDLGQPVQVWLNGNPLDAARFKVSGNTLTFLDANGTPEFVTGTVEAAFKHREPGFDRSFVKDAVVDIYDEDTPMVIIDQGASGNSLDVVEDETPGQSAGADTYRVRLTRAPAAGQTVVFKIDAVDTRTTYGRTALFQEQVTVNGQSAVSLVFDADGLGGNNWDQWQTVTVRAKFDAVMDGNDTQVFAPDLQTVNKIRGPLIIEGAAGAGSLSLPKPLMLPWEQDKLAADGHVVAIAPVPGSIGPGAREYITVTKAALDAVVTRLSGEDSNIDDPADLKGKTLELSSGPGTGIVLDPARPDDLYNRFWLILDVGPEVGGLVRLTVQNPSTVDPAHANVTAPTADSDFAITSLSINFFADEREQVDYMFVYDDDSVGNDRGVLTSSDGVVRQFEAVTGGFALTAETAALQAVAAQIDPQAVDLATLIGRQLTVTVGPGRGNVYAIQAFPSGPAIPDGAFDGTKRLFLVQVSGTATTPTLRSEFRIDGGDTKGRITGFGMGPNLLFAGRPQPGGITYGDLEVLQINLGRGNDTVEVDYTSNAEDHTTRRSGDFYTLTMLDTGLGNDTVTVRLHDGEDGAFALRLNQGDDSANAAGSTLGIAVFGEAGNDTVAGGDGDDTLFGDFGRIDYLNDDGQVVTRLGDHLPLQAVNPKVVGATDTTLSGLAGAFPPADRFGGLVGLMVQAISPEGDVQFRRIVAHTTDTLTVDAPWDQVPSASYYYRVSTLPEDQTDGSIRGARLAWTIDLEDGQGNPLGGSDTVLGGGGADQVLGGAFADQLGGGAGDDLVVGDSVRLEYQPVTGNDGATRLERVVTIVRARGGDDTLDGDGGDDVLIGGTGADRADGGAQSDLVLGDNARLDWNLGVRDFGERFRTLAAGAGTLYDADGHALLGGRATPPGVQPAWAPWSIELDQSTIAAQFGNDQLAGGAHADMLFGQRGDDTIQGDGARSTGATATRPAGGTLSVTPSVENAGSDGDDYIEGNAGRDVLFGNLGQDDLVGGSSDLYSLARGLRDDEGDLVFGGAGNAADDLLRNADGGGLRGEDADAIAGDNADIVRIVQGGAPAGFAYDDDLAKYGRAIVVRAVALLDYTPGNQTGSGDLGAGDELHGESGDDAVYGMAGNDVLFGEGHDDDLIGGWGHDWISGGTGQDGVVGDDGRIMTSRNGTAEALHGVAAAIEETISTPGRVQQATINVGGQLKKSVNLAPFNVQGSVGAVQDPRFDAQQADDLIFGGLDGDFLHGGAGDDGMSGAEARASGEFSYATPGNRLAGDYLGYSGVTGEFSRYDEYAPRTRIADFALDFEAGDGNRVVATNPTVKTDGDDAIFGDLGNDWLVGGTGRDNLYGGWGDDLLNADDDLSTAGGLNDSTDTAPSYEDRAYGGAGRDVLIGNTGGDRLIDWVGEFNSYIVPFAPYGNAAVSRTLQPQLAEFLYKLSAGDGADPTRAADTGADALRNGEPEGELGLIRQSDAAWQDQTGAPADPQAGNVPGGPRDVLRSASFNDGQMQGLAPDSGLWKVSGATLQVEANSPKSDAVAVYQVGDALPSYFELLATIKVIKPTAGWGANSYLVFDYQSATNFKFAGLDVATNKVVMGQRTAAGWQVLKQGAYSGSIKSDTWYDLKLVVNGLTATLLVNNVQVLGHAYQATVVDGYSYGLNWGLVGFGANKSRGAMDNIAVQVVPPTAKVTKTETFATAPSALFPSAGTSGGSFAIAAGRYSLAPAAGAEAFSQMALGNTQPIATASLLEFSARFSAGRTAGIVFDRYSDTDFKFVAIDVATQQVQIGHRIGGQWVVDAAFKRAAIAAGVDLTLGVTLRGSTVSVTLEGQAVGGFAYNAVTVDGRFGVFARGATASFDTVTAKTNDAGVPATLLLSDAAAASLAASARTGSSAPAASVDEAALRSLLAEAARRWALVDSALQIDAAALRVATADLQGATLATYQDGLITIDRDAAGAGWFVDATPADDREFLRAGALQGAARPAGLAAGRVDLLSVLSHELGHALGLDHRGGVMAETIGIGQRVVPQPGSAVPGAVPAAPSSAEVAIDWTLPSERVRERFAARTLPQAGPDWQQRFVTRLGAGAHDAAAGRWRLVV